MTVTRTTYHAEAGGCFSVLLGGAIVGVLTLALVVGVIYLLAGIVAGGIDTGLGCEKGDAATARLRPECRNADIDEEHTERGDFGGKP